MHDYILLGFCQRLRFQRLRLYSVVILITKFIDYIGFKCCAFLSLVVFRLLYSDALAKALHFQED